MTVLCTSFGSFAVRELVLTAWNLHTNRLHVHGTLKLKICTANGWTKDLKGKLNFAPQSKEAVELEHLLVRLAKLYGISFEYQKEEVTD